jgi:hypothetical protein
MPPFYSYECVLLIVFAIFFYRAGEFVVGGVIGNHLTCGMAVAPLGFDGHDSWPGCPVCRHRRFPGYPQAMMT